MQTALWAEASICYPLMSTIVHPPRRKSGAHRRNKVPLVIRRSARTDGHPLSHISDARAIVVCVRTALLFRASGNVAQLPECHIVPKGGREKKGETSSSDVTNKFPTTPSSGIEARDGAFSILTARLTTRVRHTHFTAVSRC